jgi:hypothetical protein
LTLAATHPLSLAAVLVLTNFEAPRTPVRVAGLATGMFDPAKPYPVATLAEVLQRCLDRGGAPAA